MDKGRELSTAEDPIEVQKGKDFPRLHSKLWLEIKSEHMSLTPRSGHLPFPPLDGLQRPPDMRFTLYSSGGLVFQTNFLLSLFRSVIPLKILSFVISLIYF